MLKKIFLSNILILSLALVFLAWGDVGKKEMKSETPQIQKTPVESPIVTDPSNEKPKAESPASPLQSYKIPWSSINAGGNLNLSSGNYKMKGSVGQSAIGQSQSTNYKMGMGFWYGVQDTTVCTDKAGDANGSGGNPNLSDIIYLVNYIFKGGSAPVKSGVCCS